MARLLPRQRRVGTRADGDCQVDVPEQAVIGALAACGFLWFALWLYLIYRGKSSSIWPSLCGVQARQPDHQTPGRHMFSTPALYGPSLV